MTTKKPCKQRACIYAIATLDTKQEEILFVANAIKKLQVEVVIVDVSTAKGNWENCAEINGLSVIDVNTVSEHYSHGSDYFDPTQNPSLTRGDAIAAMSQALATLLEADFADGKFSAVMGLGGGGGTSLIAHAMQALPIGVPKLIVSTMVSGNVAPYVGCSDITLMYSVVDIAGLNAISNQVLTNAAAAMAGMTNQIVKADNSDKEDRPATIAMSMFGVTTPCVDMVRKKLSEAGNHCLVFHATGSGGKAMEKLVASGLIDGVLDITTTEIADEVVGGTLSAGPERLDAILNSQLPYVLSLGALDMVNFASLDTVPEKFKHRQLHSHNPDVTLMRTNVDDCKAIGKWIADKLNRSTAPVILMIPEKGLSVIDAEGQAFFDAEADAALFETLTSGVIQTPQRQVRCLPYNINDPEFSDALIEAYLTLASNQK